MKIIVGPDGMHGPHPCRRSRVDLCDETIIHAQRAQELGLDGFTLTERWFWYDAHCPPRLPAWQLHTRMVA